MKTKQRARAGFSLIEVLAAIVVLGLVVAAVSSSLASSIQFNARAERRMLAELAVSNAVERMRAEGYDDTVDYPGDERFQNVVITVDSEENIGTEEAPNLIGYTVTVKSSAEEWENISVTTFVRTPSPESSEEGDG